MLTYSQAKECINEWGRTEFENILEQYDEKALEACFELGIAISDFQEAYQGKYSDDEDFAQKMAEELGSFDKNASWPNNCIDWEYAAKELMYDYAEEFGYYFRNC
jgi:antirestriction protein